MIWNGKKPRMKLENTFKLVREGGICMINFCARLVTQKLDIIQKALDTTYMQFWQTRLYSLFTIPFDLLIRCNLNFSSLKNFMVKPLPAFWNDVFGCWCDFHFRNARLKVISEDNFKEVLYCPVKRYAPCLKEFFNDKGWSTMADMIYVGSRNFRAREYVSAILASKIIKSIPLQWCCSQVRVDNYDTNAQTFIHQKWPVKNIYASLLTSTFHNTVQAWQVGYHGFTYDSWLSLAKKSSLIVKIYVKNFFVLFNNRAIYLNNVFAHIDPDTSNVCTFCKTVKETYEHLFYQCNDVKGIWNYACTFLLSKHDTI